MTDRTATGASTPPVSAVRRAPGTRRAALAAASAVVLTACSAALATDSDADEIGIDVATGAHMVEWGDDRTHLVVATEAAPGTAGVESDDDAPLTLVTPQGRRVLDGPPPVLLPVTPADPREQEMLDAAPPGSFIGVDVDGELGEPGTRYLRTLTSVHTLDAVDDDVVDDPTDEGSGSSGSTGAGEEIFAELDGSTGTGEATADGQEPGGGSGPVAIQLGSGVIDREIAEQIAAIGGVAEVEVVGTGIIAVAVEPAAETAVAEAIAVIDGVTSVNDDLLAYVSGDARQAEQWAIDNTGAATQAAGWQGVAGADIRADEAWNVTTGAGVVVAVIDSGQDLGHRDLAANGWTNTDEVCGNGFDDDANGYVDDCRGWDFGSHDGNPSPPPSSNGFHGTHVAGIVAAAQNGVGVVGATPDAVLMPLKVAREDGAIPMSGVAAAINYAVDNGARVINLSLGTAPGTWLGSNSPTELAIRHARSRGVVVVVAAGNDGANLDSSGPGWPAGFSKTYDNVLTVGASRNDDTHAYFSNTGSYVGLHAPGWAVLSTLPGNTEGFRYGTSMAAPYAAAGAAAVIAAGRAATPAAVIARLKGTATDLGWGTRLDLAAAVGYEAPLTGRQLEVTVGGADRLVAETPSTLDWTVQAAAGTTGTGVRMSVAARHEGVISAVEGLEITFSDERGVIATVASDATGAFPVLPIRDPAALVGGGSLLSGSFSAPATEYAFVLELVDGGGAEASDRSVTYVSVPAPEPPAGGNAPTTTTPPNTPSTTTVPGAPAPTTSVPASGPPTTPAPDAPAPAPAPGPGTPVTTAPPTPPPGPPTGPGAPAPTTPPPGPPGGPGAPAPSTTQPGGGAIPPATGAPTTSLAPPAPPVVTPPDGAPGPATTTTTTSVPTAPGTTAPGAPTPGGPARDGVYRADTVSPTSGPTTGLTRVTVTGRFPTTVPVYVWFGDQPTAVAAGYVNGTELTVDSPAVGSAGTRDIVVRFATERPYELRLANAFTYIHEHAAPTPTTPPPTAIPPVTTTTVPGTPPAPGGPGRSPGTTTTSSTVPGGAPQPTPPTPGPTTSVPSDPGGGTPPSGGGGGEPAPARRLGGLTLRQQPTTGALASLTLGSWPATGCRSAVCPGTRL